MTIPVLSYRQRGGGVHVDLDMLVRSRMLIQANSGGGKSWALRQLLEETFGRVQHLVIDPEGEYHTLREQFDYILAAKHGGDAEASPRTAKTLCRRLMETSASGVIDLYDLAVPQRREFVKLFLMELMALPKDLRRPLLVVLDEAHVFAPEGAKSDALEAVMSLASQGRKRGYALVCATQRLSKLSKDVAAEMLTRLIGRTGLDLDVKRAGDELGMDKEGRGRLPVLEPGQFYAFGPALPPGPPRLVRTGDIRTSHPQPGALEAPTPPPSAKVKALLAKSFADLPQQAAEEARNLAELQREVSTLRTKLTKAEKGQGTRTVEKQVTVVDQKAIDRAVNAAVKHYQSAIGQINRQVQRAYSQIKTGLSSIETLPAPNMEGAGGSGQVADKAATAGSDTGATAVVASRREKPSRVPFTPSRDSTVPPASSNGALPKGERIVLTAVAQHGDEGVTREQLTVLTGYKRSTRDAYVQRMNQSGLVQVEANGSIIATPDGIAALGDSFEPLPTGEALYEHWMNGSLPEGEKRILRLVHDAYPGTIRRDAISEDTGYARSSRDAYIQRLAARKLVVPTRDGVKMSENLV